MNSAIKSRLSLLINIENMSLKGFFLCIAVFSVCLCNAQDTVSIKERTRLSSPDFDSITKSVNYVFHSDSLVVAKVSSKEFAQMVLSISEKKRVIVFVWAAWCHFSFSELRRVSLLNNAKDTVIFLSADIPSKSQVSYIKDVASFYGLSKTYLIENDFILSKKLDENRVIDFLKPISTQYDGGYPYYMLISRRFLKKEGHTRRSIGL